MFRKIIFAASAGIALIAQPIAAQDSAEDEEALTALMEMFKAEPLTEEQEARLPLAGEVITRVIPEGAMGEMMGSLFDGMLKPMMEMESEPTAENVAEQMGVGEYEIALESENAAEAIAILDPAWTERKQIEAAMMPQIMSDMMTAMEPTMRKAMTEVYAVHFTTEELNDVNDFFKTTSGANYARKSFTISSDPRLMASVMEAMPQMMGFFEEMGEKMEAATAELPEARSFEEINIMQRARLAELTGLSVEDIETAMAAKAATEAENMGDVVEDAVE